jgi:hypothetical protein
VGLFNISGEKLIKPAAPENQGERARDMHSVRQRLASRRPSEFFEFESMGMRFTASVSRYPDGRLGEIFIDNHKAGSAIGTLVRDSAIAFSFAIQCGADPEQIRTALCRDSQGNASGPLGAALDLIANSSSAVRP